MSYTLQLQSRLTGAWRERVYDDLRTAVGAYFVQSHMERTKRAERDVVRLLTMTGSHTSSGARLGPYVMVRLARR